MHRILEIILGLKNGFLSQEGEYHLQFNPSWPFQDSVGAATWNLLFALAAAALVVYVYRREGRHPRIRILLGGMRALLLAFLIVMLNHPLLVLEQIRREPSVVAILIDNSISMQIRDAGLAADGTPRSRLAAVADLFTGHDRQLLRELGTQHTIKLYRFDRDAQELATINGTAEKPPETIDLTLAPSADALGKLQAIGQSTQVVTSVRTVLDDLQSQRLAGIVVLTDGRDVPAEPLADALDGVKNFGVPIYSVPIGSEKPPRNIAIQSIDLEPSAFKDDFTNVKVAVRATGYEPKHPVVVVLKDKRTGLPLKNDDGSDVRQTINVSDDKPADLELQFKPRTVGTLDLIVEAERQPGEVNEDDNIRTAQIAVLDVKITLLFVDGYPRWEYRYLKNGMIRDKTVTLSCLLTSADPSFRQEGTKPITRFPESIEEMMDYDVVLFGDVDPRQFTDAQLQLVSEFVSKKGGGFGMVAGPRWSPQSFRNTPLEPILPVGITKVEADTNQVAITQGFRPVMTKVGADSSIFRFFADRDKSLEYMKTGIQPLFWYCRGITAKPGVAEVYAEHPTDLGPDGRKAPILVLGRFGAGRTLFSAIDDSWRWRYYTGESVFDTYWVQQLRYLARSKKLGQRKLTFTALQTSYDLGQQITLQMRVLAAPLLSQLPDPIPVELVDDTGKVVRRGNLSRQDGEPDLYAVSFVADTIGHLTARLPKIIGDIDALETPVDVSVPRLELVQPQVDRTLLSTLGQSVDYAVAATELPKLIRSAAKVVPVDISQPLWDAPLALAIIATLITMEWLLRKMFGMV